MQLHKLRIGGFARWSTCDWPGKLAATVFLQGCPWRCSYCHNPHLLDASAETEISWEEVISFLKRRRGLLDGVVFSGGEPTLQSSLISAMQEVKELGFQVGLHSAGPYPKVLRALLPFIDWIGFDVKAPFDGYDKITQTPNSAIPAQESLQIVLDAGISYEVRTTVHPKLLTNGDVETLKIQLHGMGVQEHKIQVFRSAGCVTSSLL